MKRSLFLLVFGLLDVYSVISGQEKAVTRPDYNREFQKNAIPGSYEEISFTREKLILLKKYEPITEEKIAALVFLRVVSKTQGAILSTKHDNQGKIVIPEFEKALKEKNMSLSLVQRILEYLPGPYSKEILDKMVILGVITNEEKAQFFEFLTQEGYIPGILPEQAVIVVKDNWEGLPLNSYGMLDSEKMLEELYKGRDLTKFYKLVEKHQKLLIELEDVSNPKHVTTAKDLKKARAKQEKDIEALEAKLMPLEKEIAETRDLMAYLYLAGLMQNRYASGLAQIKDVERDSATLISCFLKPSKGKEKVAVITKDRISLEGQERFICVDKTLLWLTNNTSASHKRLAENVLRILLDNIGHPPFDAPAEMWLQWWQMQQKKAYYQISGLSPRQENESTK